MATTVLETFMKLKDKFHPEKDLPERDYKEFIPCFIYIMIDVNDAHMLDDFLTSIDTSSFTCAQTALEAARMFRVAEMPGALVRLINSDLFLNSAFIKLDEHEHSMAISRRLPFGFMIDNKDLLRKEIIEKMEQFGPPIYSIGVGVNNEDIILCFDCGFRAYYSKAILVSLTKLFESRASFKRLRGEEQATKETEQIRIPFEYNEKFWQELNFADLYKKPLQLKSAYDVLLADYLIIENIVLDIPFGDLPVKDLVQMYNVPLLDRFEEKKIPYDYVTAYYTPTFPPLRHLNPKIQIRVAILRHMQRPGGLQDTVDQKIYLDLIKDFLTLGNINLNGPGLIRW
jgi:hypothetical protein